MKNKRRRYAALILIISLFVLFFAIPVSADDPKAREIMEKVDARDDGDNMTGEMAMILFDKKGKQRVRKIYKYSKDKGKDTYNVLFFLHPADVKDTGFLTYDYDDPDKDDDQWLYLPALRKTKRIATKDKSSSFMGSDLNYSDMTSFDLQDYDFTLKQEMDVKGVKTWLIEAVPRTKEVIDETGYKKSLLFVRQDNFVIIRSVKWEKSGGYIKYMEVKKLERIAGIWTNTEIHMTRKKGRQKVHKTILRFDNVQYGQPLDFDTFTIRRLEKGM
jgi:hypothetical protein